MQPYQTLKVKLQTHFKKINITIVYKHKRTLNWSNWTPFVLVKFNVKLITFLDWFDLEMKANEREHQAL
jgi:hypothetical protein